MCEIVRIHKESKELEADCRGRYPTVGRISNTRSQKNAYKIDKKVLNEKVEKREKKKLKL